MFLYLGEDLIKSSIKYDYWPQEKGAPPPGQGWEQSPTGSWRRPRGSAPVGMSDHGEAPDVGDHDPLTHYKLANRHKQAGNDEQHGAHSQAAKQKAGKLKPEEHKELADQLKTEGMHDEAKHHLSLAAGSLAKEAKDKELKDVVEGSAPKDPMAAKEHWKGGKKSSTDLVEKYKDKSPEELNKLALDHVDKDGKKTPEYKALVALANKKGKEAPTEQGQDSSEPIKPSSSFEHAQTKGHTSEAKKLKENVESHLGSEEVPEDEKEKLRHVAQALEDHINNETVPTDEQKSELRDLKELSGDRGKEPNPDKQPEEKGSSSSGGGRSNYSAMFNRASAAGSQAGKAADSPYGAGQLGSMPIDYAGSGAVKLGHKVLTSDSKDQEPEEKPKKKGSETSQSSMKSLYLSKASAGVLPKGDEQARLEYEDSFSTQYAGVSGDAVTEDRKDIGRHWKHDNENSADDQTEDEVNSNKSVEPASVTMLKSLNDSINYVIKSNSLTDLEMSFLTSELGYDPVSVRKGLYEIKGLNRAKFNEWAHTKLQKSLENLR